MLVGVSVPAMCVSVGVGVVVGVLKAKPSKTCNIPRGVAVGGVPVLVGFGVSVTVNVGVAAVGDGVNVGVGVRVGVREANSVNVAVCVTVGVSVGVGEIVGVLLIVGVDDAILVGVFVYVKIRVGVRVGVPGTGVEVNVGCRVPKSVCTIARGVRVGVEPGAVVNVRTGLGVIVGVACVHVTHNSGGALPSRA